MQGDDRKWAFITGSLFILCFGLIFLTCSTLNAHAIEYPSEESAEVRYSELVSDSLTVGASAEEVPPDVEFPDSDFGEASDFPYQDEPDDFQDDFIQDAGDLIIGESEDLTVGESGLTIGMSAGSSDTKEDDILKELSSIRSCMEIIVYFVVPAAVAILLIYKFCIWFYKTFIDSAFL